MRFEMGLKAFQANQPFLLAPPNLPASFTSHAKIEDGHSPGSGPGVKSLPNGIRRK